ncbi:MAG: tRNA (adenosine(37)-N6)-dimethylallyltransferase MiaA [Planctomycetes bacterium]|nr:tRNA (adenosine(37)-N6)-dimethylallyltransferase MiaA [Planctomycetota bacterium]
MQHHAIVIAGATASGKSALALWLALHVPGGGEIVSADSMQVWRGMDIGTAKPTPAEREQVPHHAIDLADPHRDAFSAADWLREAQRAIAGIQSRGRTPIVVGGTNLYLRLLLEGMVESARPDPEFRRSLEELDAEALRQRLSQVDPESAARLHANDRRRIIRALEIARATGAPASSTRSQWASGAPNIPEGFHMLLLELENETLNQRINARVQKFVEAGWLDEVNRLTRSEPLLPQALEAVGYRELLDALESRCSLNEAVEAIKIRTRRYAKQQRTWLRRFQTSQRCLTLKTENKIFEKITLEALTALFGSS